LHATRCSLEFHSYRCDPVGSALKYATPCAQSSGDFKLSHKPWPKWLLTFVRFSQLPFPYVRETRPFFRYANGNIAELYTLSLRNVHYGFRRGSKPDIMPVKPITGRYIVNQLESPNTGMPARVRDLDFSAVTVSKITHNAGASWVCLCFFSLLSSKYLCDALHVWMYVLRKGMIGLRHFSHSCGIIQRAVLRKVTILNSLCEKRGSLSRDARRHPYANVWRCHDDDFAAELHRGGSVQGAQRSLQGWVRGRQPLLPSPAWRQFLGARHGRATIRLRFH
jgi:hypothetical protein